MRRLRREFSVAVMVMWEESVYFATSACRRSISCQVLFEKVFEGNTHIDAVVVLGILLKLIWSHDSFDLRGFEVFLLSIVIVLIRVVSHIDSLSTGGVAAVDHGVEFTNLLQWGS